MVPLQNSAPLSQLLVLTANSDITLTRDTSFSICYKCPVSPQLGQQQPLKLPAKANCYLPPLLSGAQWQGSAQAQCVPRVSVGASGMQGENELPHISTHSQASSLAVGPAE